MENFDRRSGEAKRSCWKRFLPEAGLPETTGLEGEKVIIIVASVFSFRKRF